MKKILFIIAFLPLLAIGQTQPKDSIVPNGKVIGNQTTIPIAVAAPGYAMGQALIYYPDDYFLPANANKRYPLFVFLHGAGEGANLNISEVNKTSLPYLISSKGLKPYAIDKTTGDTVKFIVVSPHCAKCGGSYSFPQLKYTVDFLFKAYRVDTSCVFFGGLSSGGSCTISMAMGTGGNFLAADTLVTKRITGVMDMANGGYDDNINNKQGVANMDTFARRGGVFLWVIGDMDPGNNDIGFKAYKKNLLNFCWPGRFLDSTRKNTAHTDSVWNIPFPITSRVWSKSMNSWDLMWSFRKQGSSPAPPANPLKGKAKLWVDSLTKHYPNTFFHFADSSTVKHNFTSWGVTVNTSDDPGQWTSGGPYSPDMFLFNLKDGLYKVQLIIGDDAGNTDTATITLKAYGPPACPVCPICPAPRNVKTLQVQLWEGIWITVPLEAAKIGYDDGTNQ